LARANIAHYRRLAPGTVSRRLKRLRQDRILVIERHEVELLRRDPLEKGMTAPTLRQ